jgi:isopentenyl diphosphate isomerase/L-lactate dehydrogenase-like FMN-dependent dehydrogenase
LAALGEDGVAKALHFLHDELDQTMALCGVTDVHKLPDDLIFGRDLATLTLPGKMHYATVR